MCLEISAVLKYMSGIIETQLEQERLMAKLFGTYSLNYYPTL